MIIITIFNVCDVVNELILLLLLLLYMKYDI